MNECFNLNQIICEFFVLIQRILNPFKMFYTSNRRKLTQNGNKSRLMKGYYCTPAHLSLKIRWKPNLEHPFC